MDIKKLKPNTQILQILLCIGIKCQYKAVSSVFFAYKLLSDLLSIMQNFLVIYILNTSQIDVAVIDGSWHILDHFQEVIDFMGYIQAVNFSFKNLIRTLANSFEY